MITRTTDRTYTDTPSIHIPSIPTSYALYTSILCNPLDLYITYGYGTEVLSRLDAMIII